VADPRDVAAAVALADALGVSCTAFARCSDIVAVYGGAPYTARKAKGKEGAS
jgi:hypothetical protein